MTDILNLKALAEAATRGEWTCSEKPNGGFWQIGCGNQAIGATHSASKKHNPEYAAMFEANARYIAAANPAAVLELIAQTEEDAMHMRAFGEVMRSQAEQIEQLKAENERLQRFETAYKEFSDKTDWVRPNPATQELGMHVADILRKRCDDLTAHCQAQADEVVALREELKPLEEELQKTELRALKFIHRFNASTDLCRELRLALEAIEALEDPAPASKIAYDALEPFRAHAAAKAETTAQEQQP